MELEEYLKTLNRLIAPLRFSHCERDSQRGFVIVSCIDDPTHLIGCRICQRNSPRRGHLPLRRVRHLDFDGDKVFLQFCFPRVECNTHGVVMAFQSFFLPHSGFSIPFIDCALDLVSDDVSASEVARRLNITRNVLRRILDSAYRMRRKEEPR